MDINITGRNIDLDGALKDYINKRLEKLEKLYKRIYRCEVVLEEEKERKNTEIILHLKRNRIIAKESSSDIYASVDIAAQNIKRQLRRLHGRVQSKRRKTVLGRLMGSVTGFGSDDEIIYPDGRGDIIKTNAFADKPMLPEEAKLELELSENKFMMFKNADTGETNVLYRKGDGNFGLIEPNF